jgi:hypothetical protein
LSFHIFVDNFTFHLKLTGYSPIQREYPNATKQDPLHY